MSFWVRHDATHGTIEPSTGRGTWRGAPDRPTLAMRGLLLFLVPLTSMFGLVIAAYVMRRHMGDWQALSMPWQLWLSTLLLAGSSLGFEQARRAAVSAVPVSPRPGLTLAAALAVAFLLSQLWAWQSLVQQGHVLAANPANSFFYLMSGLHALHLTGGLVAWTRARQALARGRADQARLVVRLCAVYWHFLLAVWLVLFGVLLLVA
ncbi:cytochrome c oxidase subunit 3 [Natronocella acetinitrilica]|uniref:Cytochrome c oxidase subunit 3 n=1 Tax=Natronocella acetinitrilica TaxID=414046 RepID=A0AAE3KC86_9GAMM|nr:cytochrome c oxidase subunit 3 [Natronocella acetinitrilica]MCP1674643.1 cytochrome c oxidase subunit 3 [Natronocella acetinitrilica]